MSVGTKLNLFGFFFVILIILFGAVSFADRRSWGVLSQAPSHWIVDLTLGVCRIVCVVGLVPFYSSQTADHTVDVQ